MLCVLYHAHVVMPFHCFTRPVIVQPSVEILVCFGSVVLVFFYLVVSRQLSETAWCNMSLIIKVLHNGADCHIRSIHYLPSLCKNVYVRSNDLPKYPHYLIGWIHSGRCCSQRQEDSIGFAHGGQA